MLDLDLGRWAGPVDDADETVLARCTAPVLDVGCGPGRLVTALAERGRIALGVDITAAAVRLTRRRGGPALLRDVFERTPGEGRWPTALLVDGNVGIGGDPVRLLRRVRTLITAGGRLLVEAHPDADADHLTSVRFRCGAAPLGPPFPWAQLGLRTLCRDARRAGYAVGEVWSAHGRSFAALRPCAAP